MEFQDDCSRMMDVLNSQKRITQAYNYYAAECTTQTCKDKLMEILNEDQQIEFDLVTEMQKRNWYQPEPADTQEVSKLRQHFEKRGNDF